MNEKDIKKCIKHGYAWKSDGDKPIDITSKSYQTRIDWRWALRNLPHLHATKAAAQFAIATKREDARIAARKAAGTQVTPTETFDSIGRDYYNEKHAKWLADMQSQTTPITPEQGKMLRITDTVFAIVLQTIEERHIDGSDIPHDIGLDVYYFTRAAAQDALDKAKASTLPEGVAPVPDGYVFVDPKKEPRKLGPLSRDGWLVSHKGGQWTVDTGMYRFHTIQDLCSADCLLKGRPIYFACPKAEAEPLEWCERKKGEVVQDGDDVSDMRKEFDLQALGYACRNASDSWIKASGWIDYSVGKVTCCDYIVRARYRNPLWLAKYGKPVESHETPVGETQAKKVVTDETQHSPSRTLSDAEFEKLFGCKLVPIEQDENDEITHAVSLLKDALKRKTVDSIERPDVGNDCLAEWRQWIHVLTDIQNLLTKETK